MTRQNKSSTENTFVTSTGRLARVMIGEIILPEKSPFAGTDKEDFEPVLIQGMPSKEWNQASVEVRLDAMGFRDDVMCKEIAGRNAPSRAVAIRGNFTRKKKQEKQEESKAEWQDFHGGADMYSGPLGPPEDK